MCSARVFVTRSCAIPGASTQKRRAVRSSIAVLLLTSVVAVMASACCCEEAAKGFKQGLENSQKPKTVTDDSGLLKVELPGTWSNIPALNDQAQLQYGNLLDNSFMIAISEPTSDFDDDFTTERHSDLTRGLLKSGIKNYKEEGPESLEINEMEAIQYKLKGSVDGVKITYYHTTIAGPKHFHQVLIWTSTSNWKSQRKSFDKILQTVQDTNVPSPKRKSKRKKK